MRKAIWLMVGVFLGCVTLAAVALAESDPWGNEYPAVCTPEATSAAIRRLTIIEVNRLPTQKNTASRCGFYDNRFFPPIILVLKSCTVPRSKILRHEGCHALILNWHN